MTSATKEPQDGWDGILDTDEKIIWQGRPDGGFFIKPSMIFLILFGTAFAGFALFWMIMASLAGGYFWMFGLIHFSVGIGIISATVLGGPFIRRRTWYTLTDRRAFIAKTLPLTGRSLKSYPITADTAIEYLDGTLASIMFATKRKRGKNGTYDVPIGFERIEDGKTVLQMMRTIQKAQQ